MTVAHLDDKADLLVPDADRAADPGVLQDVGGADVGPGAVAEDLAVTMVDLLQKSNAEFDGFQRELCC